MKRGSIITVFIISIVLITGFTILVSVVHHDNVLKQRAVAAQQEQEAAQEQAAQQQATQQAQQKIATEKQNLQKCIDAANQQEISSLQYEGNLLKTEDIDSRDVNSYVQEVQQQTQTQISECQSQYPQTQ